MKAANHCDIALPTWTFSRMLSVRSARPVGHSFVRTGGRTAREKDAQTGPAPTDKKAAASTRLARKSCTLGSNKFSLAWCATSKVRTQWPVVSAKAFAAPRWPEKRSKCPCRNTSSSSFWPGGSTNCDAGNFRSNATQSALKGAACNHGSTRPVTGVVSALSLPPS